MHIIDHFDCDKVIDIGNTKYLERLSDDDIRALRAKLSIMQFNERVIPYLLQRFQLRNPSELYDMLRPQMMVITRGRSGADFWYENGSTKKELVNSTEEIDPTGAGDAFFSVFIKGFFDNSKQVDSDFIDRTFDEASQLTSEVVKNIGARGHIPEKKLEKRPGPVRKTRVSFPDDSVHDYEILQESVSYKSETEGYVIRDLESSRKGYLKHASFVRRERNGRIKFKDRNVSSYGEVVARRIADKVGISACDAEVGYIHERARDKTRTIPVAISYFDLQEAEQMVPAASIIEWFKLNYEREAREDVLGGNFSEFDWETKRVNCNIPLILTAFDRYLSEMTTASEEDRKKLRQDIIDMIVFDCKFGNTDRHDDNFGLGVSNDGSGKVRFYPLFDNEAVLGFITPDSYVRKCKDDYSKLHPNFLWSLLNFGTDFYRPADIASVERELFERYPEETANAYQKVMKLRADDLEEILGDYPELSSDNPKRHDYIMSTFELLDKQMRQSYEEYTQGLNKRDLDSDAEDGGSQR